MNNAAEYIAGFIELILKVRFEAIGQGNVPCLITLNKITSTLINCDQVIVLVNDI